MSPSETLQNDRESAHTASAWVTSLLFWCALVVSVLLYGGVALAPKLSVWMQVRHQYLRNAQHLLALDAEVDYLERVQNALETDPDFLRRLAVASDPDTADSSEWIPVSDSLIFGRGDDSKIPDVVSAEQPPFAGPVAILASRQSLRTGLLAASCILVVFAFTFLNDSGYGLVRSAGRIASAAVKLPGRRYLRQDDAGI